MIIYSSDSESDHSAPHIRHRKFSKWITKNIPEWNLLNMIPNEHPYYGDDWTGSFADFFIYEKTASDQALARGVEQGFV